MDDKSMRLPPDNPLWSWLDVVIVLVFLFGLIPVSVIFREPIQQFFIYTGIEKNKLRTLALFWGTFLQASVMIIAVVILTKRKGASLSDLGITKVFEKRNIFQGILGGGILALVIWTAGIIMSLIMGPPPPQEVERLLTGLKAGEDFILPFVAIAVFAPVSEEFFFRGMVYPLARSRFGPVQGMILSGIIFGSMHFDLYRTIPLAAGGAVLAYLYEKTGSLVTPIIAHAIWNSIMLLILYFAGNYLKNIQ